MKYTSLPLPLYCFSFAPEIPQPTPFSHSIVSVRTPVELVDVEGGSSEDHRRARSEEASSTLSTLPHDVSHLIHITSLCLIRHILPLPSVRPCPPPPPPPPRNISLSLLESHSTPTWWRQHTPTWCCGVSSREASKEEDEEIDEEEEEEEDTYENLVPVYSCVYIYIYIYT